MSLLLQPKAKRIIRLLLERQRLGVQTPVNLKHFCDGATGYQLHRAQLELLTEMVKQRLIASGLSDVARL